MLIEFEQWRPVVGFEGWYEVSSLGRVKRVMAANGARVGKVLKPLFNGTGHYAEVGLWKLGKQHRRKVHSLVARAWITNPLGLPEVNHIKGKEKWNNAVSNLEWITTKGNHQHAAATGLKACGEKNASAKLTWAKVAIIRARYAQGDIPQWKLAAEYGVSQAAVWGIVSGKSWKEVAA